MTTAANRTTAVGGSREVLKMRTVCRATLLLGLILVATTAVVSPAGAAGKVGPKQYFTGVINGTDGNTATPITIQMGCFGPLRPGQTGHPMKGQTLAVHQLYPPSSTTGSLGYTGHDSEIGVFFKAPPKAAVAASAAAKTVIFMHYDTPQRLSTSLTLPCGGTGTIWFTPIPVLTPSRSAKVSVQFAGQP